MRLGPSVNPKYSAGPSTSDILVIIAHWDQTDLPLRLDKKLDKFSETANSISQFINTIIIKSSEISKLTPEMVKNPLNNCRRKY